MSIAEKSDLDKLENRIMKYLEMSTGNSMKMWFTLEDLAELRSCSLSELTSNPLVQPNYGVPDDRWGRKRVWSRYTVENWLRKTRAELDAMAQSFTPVEIERIELLKKSKSYQKGA